MALVKIITTHLSADFDAFAAAVCCVRLYPDHRVLFPGSLEATVRRFLAATAFAFPEVKLREARRATIEHAVVVDTATPHRLGEAWQLLERAATPITLVDHHADAAGSLAATTVFVRPVGATCTIVSSLLRERGLTPAAEEASLLLMGIYEDTGSLSYRDTTATDLREAAFLLEAGGSLEWVRRWVVKALEPDQLELLNRVVDGAEQITVHDVPVAISLVEVDRYHEEAAYVVHRWMETFQLPLAVAMLVKPPHVNVIIRSHLPEVDAGELAALVGGGGHATAAAARVSDLMPVEIRERILARLDDLLPPPARAGDVAVRQIFSVGAEVTVAAAKERLNQLRVNAVPIADPATGAFVGTVSRQLLDHSLDHGMGDRPVRTVMQPGVLQVADDTPLDEVRELFFDTPHRFVIVTDDDRPCGLLTRMELFRRLFSRQTDAGSSLDHRIAGTRPVRQSVVRTLRQRTPPWVQQLLLEVRGVAEEHAVPVYLVGGMVRDLLLDRPNEDVDLVVEGDGLAFATRLAQRLGARCHPHEPFKTAVLVLADGHRVDVASARTEYYRTPGALPEVATSLIRQDLYRRDFTVNTLAVALAGDQHGHLVDFFAGRKDLARKEIRVLHSLSFIDDPTRAIRAVRYARRLGFSIAPDTRHLIATAVAEGVFDHLSGHRLRRELDLLLGEGHPTPAMALLAELGLLTAISPQLAWSEERRSLLLEVEAQLAWYHLQNVGPLPPAWLLYLGAVVAAAAPVAATELAERLQLAGTSRARLVELPARVTGLRSAASTESTLSVLVAAVEAQPSEVLLVAMATLPFEQRQRLAKAAETGARTPPPVSGRDLVAGGVPPGPWVGAALEQTRGAVIDGTLVAADALVAALDLARADAARRARR